MKRLFSLLMAMAMLLSFSTVGFAETAGNVNTGNPENGSTGDYGAGGSYINNGIGARATFIVIDATSDSEWRSKVNSSWVSSSLGSVKSTRNVNSGTFWPQFGTESGPVSWWSGLRSKTADELYPEITSTFGVTQEQIEGWILDGKYPTIKFEGYVVNKANNVTISKTLIEWAEYITGANLKNSASTDFISLLNSAGSSGGQMPYLNPSPTYPGSLNFLSVISLGHYWTGSTWVVHSGAMSLYNLKTDEGKAGVQYLSLRDLGTPTMTGTHKLKAEPDDKVVEANTFNTMKVSILPKGIPAAYKTKACTLQYTVSTSKAGVSPSSKSGTFSVTGSQLNDGSELLVDSFDPGLTVTETVSIPWTSSNVILKAPGLPDLNLGTASDPASFIVGPPPTMSAQEWKSEPQGYGEIKQGTYSVGRGTEIWEAMAGVPHDEHLYYDAGASALSAHLKVDNVTTQNRPSNPSVSDPVSGHTNSSCSDCGAWICGECGIDGSSCGGNHTECGTCCSGHSGSHSASCEDDCSSSHTYTDGCGNACYNYDCTDITHPEHSHSWTLYLPSIQAHPMNNYKVLAPSEVNETAGYTAVGTITIDAAMGTATVATRLRSWSFSWASTPTESKMCHECTAWATSIRSQVNAQVGDVLSTFYPELMDMTDRDGRKYRAMYPDNVEFKLRSGPVTNGCGGSGSLYFDFEATGAAVPSSGTYKLWDPPFRAATGLNKSNFMPYEEDWDTKTKLVPTGYNGTYSSTARRASGNKFDHLFYEEGLAFTSLIRNGEKTTGSGTITFGHTVGTKGNAQPISTASTKYSDSHSSVNNVVVHSPVAVDTYYITRDYLPSDQMLTGPLPGVFLTPTQDFVVHSTINWAEEVETTQQGMGNTTTLKGISYELGMSTLRWMQAKYYRFKHEVIKEDTNERFDANEWIQIPPEEESTRFILPVSEREVTAANNQYDVVVIAKNSPHIGNPQAAYNDAERIQNFERNDSPKAAKHSAFLDNRIDIVGRIGNFVVEYTPDPNWQTFFSKKTTGWDVVNLIPKVDTSQYNKYLAPHHDIFDRQSWDYVGPGNFITGFFNFGLNHFNNIPSLNGAQMGDLLPAGPGKNLESTGGLLQYEAIKIGYPVWWSIQTIGNYGDSSVILENHPSLYLFDPNGVNNRQAVDCWVKVGTKYVRVFDYNGRINPLAYDSVIRTKLTHNERRISASEKQLTKDVEAVYPNTNKLFDPTRNISVGTLNGMDLNYELRTYIGTQTFEGNNHQPNPTTNGTAIAHGRQAQRWHGSIIIPSSARFTVAGSTTAPSESNFINTKNKLLLVTFKFKTRQSAPWNITTEDELIVGSNRELFYPWIQFIPENETLEDMDPTDPDTYYNTFPPDPVLIFDPNKPATKDIQIHGTY